MIGSVAVAILDFACPPNMIYLDPDKLISVNKIFIQHFHLKWRFLLTTNHAGYQAGVSWPNIEWLFLTFTKKESMIGLVFYTFRTRQNGRHFADDIFNRIFVKENVRISIKFSLKFVHKGPINNIPALVQIMAWRRPGGKPLSEPVMVSLLTHICVARPQWVKSTE